MMNRQRGVALISVLLIVALASILVTKMTNKLLMQMQRTVNIGANQQAYWYALGAEAFAKSVLKTTFKEEPDVTHLGQYWAQGETSYPVEYGEIVGEITDLQACFNLNALRAEPATGAASPSGTTTKSAARESFEDLLLTLGIDEIDDFAAEYMADALTDFLDPDTLISSAGGAEDSDYSGRQFPYLAANNYIVSVNELRVIEHFTPKVINALKGLVCVIPDSELHQININTINVDHYQLVQALLGVSAADAQNILEERGEKGYQDIADFFASPSMASLTITEQQKQQFAIDSEYFKINTMASFNQSYVSLNSVLQVSNNQKINVIARSIGRE